MNRNIEIDEVKKATFRTIMQSQISTAKLGMEIRINKQRFVLFLFTFGIKIPKLVRNTENFIYRRQMLNFLGKFYTY